MKKKNTFSQGFHKLLGRVTLWLRINAIADGIEVSDHAIRLAWNGKKGWTMKMVRLEPGVVVAGAIKDRAAFAAALLALKESVWGAKGKNRHRNVVLSLSSANVYNQLFDLPIVAGESLNKAVELNIQMASPADASQSYSGWEIAEKNDDVGKYEIVSMFIDRQVVDDAVAALRDAGFIAVAAESKALSIARAFKENGQGMDLANAYILVRIDDAGVDFTILRAGQMYFEYAIPWLEMADEKGMVPREELEATIAKSLHQVMNFYGQHWSSPVAGIIVDAGELESAVAAIAAKEFPQPVIHAEIAIQSIPVTSDFFVALGAGLRGLEMVLTKADVNLLGAEAQMVFQKERLAAFARFWRLAFPIIFCCLVGIALAGNIFLADTEAGLKQSESLHSEGSSGELAQLTTEASTFNNSLAILQAAETRTVSASALFDHFQSLAASSSIVITQLTFPGAASPLSLLGTASSQTDVLLFKQALEGDATIQNVNMPLSSIQSNGGQVTFSVTFNLE